MNTTEQVESKEEVKPLNLFQKIHAVMKDVEYLQKDDAIKFGTTSYKAISEEKVTSTVRASLLQHGLIIMPVEQDHYKEGNLSTVNTKYKIVDIDTGNYEIIVSSGTGADTQDKGVGKAMTYSYKYLLLRTFAIPTGEDPDKVSSAELDAREQQQPNKQQQPGKRPSKGYSDTMTPEQAGAMVITFGKNKGKTLKEIYKENKGYLEWMLNGEKTDDKYKQAITVMFDAVKNKGKQKPPQNDFYPEPPDGMFDGIDISDDDLPFNMNDAS